MLELGILKTFDSENHKAGVQLVGSLTTYLDDIAVATNIAPEAMTVGNYVLVAIPGGNPRDACVVASWPQGSSGGGGSKIQDADGDTYLWVEKTADEDKIHGVVKGVEAFLLHDDGILDLPKQSGFRAHLNNAQSIPAATWTKINLDDEDFDNQAEYSLVAYTFTVKKTGKYLIAAHGSIQALDTGEWMQIRIQTNAGFPRVYGLLSGAPGDGMEINSNLVDVISRTAGDYLQMEIYHTHGSARNSGAGTGLYFSAIRMS